MECKWCKNTKDVPVGMLVSVFSPFLGAVSMDGEDYGDLRYKCCNPRVSDYNLVITSHIEQNGSIKIRYVNGFERDFRWIENTCYDEDYDILRWYQPNEWAVFKSKIIDKITLLRNKI